MPYIVSRFIDDRISDILDNISNMVFCTVRDNEPRVRKVAFVVHSGGVLCGVYDDMIVKDIKSNMFTVLSGDKISMYCTSSLCDIKVDVLLARYKDDKYNRYIKKYKYMIFSVPLRITTW